MIYALFMDAVRILERKKVTTKADFEIKLMTELHLEAVLEIQDICNLGPWSKADYQKELKNENALLLVAEKNEKVLGFASARLITSSVEILNIGVLPEERKKGIGNALLRKALELGREKKAVECWLEVRFSNLGAQKFYQKNNFQIVGRRKNYYQNPVEDAILMTLIILESNPKK